ncbi:hypothetical protein EUGRSUZ_A01162 [Eucalyptus grandis]|uniref:Uncharacterized protein n=2 Tax=Eucalyptus grandis TaxID=71139 RepID=A0ACC3M2D6_EUCGR|nr:hypothetical protein EUGRSUZ_A01162 [Eucalyptus grandis]
MYKFNGDCLVDKARVGKGTPKIASKDGTTPRMTAPGRRRSPNMRYIQICKRPSGTPKPFSTYKVVQ